jgi:hypothetical protein
MNSACQLAPRNRGAPAPQSAAPEGRTCSNRRSAATRFGQWLKDDHRRLAGPPRGIPVHVVPQVAPPGPEARPLVAPGRTASYRARTTGQVDACLSRAVGARPPPGARGLDAAKRVAGDSGRAVEAPRGWARPRTSDRTARRANPSGALSPAARYPQRPGRRQRQYGQVAAVRLTRRWQHGQVRSANVWATPTRVPMIRNPTKSQTCTIGSTIPRLRGCVAACRSHDTTGGPWLPLRSLPRR